MQVLLFGIVAEKAGAEMLDLQAGSTGALRKQLIAQIPGMDRLSYAIAVDRRIVHEDIPLSGAEEIAVLPPFAGG